MSDDALFGYLVCRLRKARDLTQDDLARQVGCAVVTIRKIEADERWPSALVAKHLAECLHILLDKRDLFTQAAQIPLDDGQLDLPHWRPTRSKGEVDNLTRKGYQLRDLYRRDRLSLGRS